MLVITKKTQAHKNAPESRNLKVSQANASMLARSTKVAATPSVIENDSMNRGLCQRNLSDKIGMFLYRYSFSIITLALVLQAAVIYGTFPTPVEMI